MVKNRKESLSTRKRFKSNDSCFKKSRLENKSNVEFSSELNKGNSRRSCNNVEFSSELDKEKSRKQSRDCGDDSC